MRCYANIQMSLESFYDQRYFKNGLNIQLSLEELMNRGAASKQPLFIVYGKWHGHFTSNGFVEFATKPILIIYEIVLCGYFKLFVMLIFILCCGPR